MEKTDELVKAVCGKGEARASSHFSVEGDVKTGRGRGKKENMVKVSKTDINLIIQQLCKLEIHLSTPWGVHESG